MMNDEDIKTVEDIAEYLNTLTFRKTTFGGVDERDVWKKIEKLNDYYTQVYNRQEAAWQAKLAEREDLIVRLRQALKQATAKAKA